MHKFFEAVFELSWQKKLELLVFVLGLNLLLSYLFLHHQHARYVELKNKAPPKKFTALECKPLNYFSLINLARESGLQKTSLKNPSDEGGNICAINLSGEGTFRSVYRFIHSLGCNQLQRLELTQDTISMVIYGFCTCKPA